MRLSVQHVTQYSFSQPISHGLQRLRLKPKSTHGQQVIDWRTELSGLTPQVEYEDQHCNHTLLVSVDSGAMALTITCTGTVETTDNAGVIGQHAGHMALWTFLNQTVLTRPGGAMRAILASLPGEGQVPPVERLHALSQAVLGTMRYETGRTNTSTTGEQAAAAGHGVCQDHAHTFIGCARAMGVPARYVSGYLMMDDRVEQEATHAWAEAWVKDLGWVGFDVSNAISPDARYIRVASGFDYRDAAPVTGMSWGSGEIELAVRLAVEQQTIEQ